MVEFRRRMQAVPWPIRLGLVGTAWGLGLLLALFWWWTYAWPYRWLTELQLRLFDAYFPFYTWAVLFVLTGLADSLVAVLIHKSRTTHLLEDLPPLFFCLPTILNFQSAFLSRFLQLLEPVESLLQFIGNPQSGFTK